MSQAIVAKFGGSSLADAKQFSKVKSIILSDERRKYIVPSAPGKRNKTDSKITDLLYKCQDLAEKGTGFDDVFNEISERYMGIVHELSVDLDISKHLEEVKTNIASGASRDYAASRGEYLNGLILASYLGFEFIDAAEIIFFNEKGSFEPELTQSSISQRLSGVEKAVIPGFYGSMPDGQVKTFSRGGSDITGAIVARGTGAALYENWTDVSGFLMTDPRIVDNPRNIAKITYRELRELAYMGATVLHEDSVFPVRQAGIPINIKNTNIPSDPGTFIVNDVGQSDEPGNITGIAGKKDFVVIAIEKTLMNSEVGFVRKLTEILEHYNVPLEHMPTGIDTICLVIPALQTKSNLDDIVEEIKVKCSPDSVKVHRDISLVAVVGRGMVRSRGVAARVFTALSKEEINIRMIDMGSSETNIILGVETPDFEKSIKAIYQEFIS